MDTMTPMTFRACACARILTIGEGKANATAR